MSCARFVVTGKVQGVYFRASTRACAARLGVTGSACNLADGTVEVCACGTPEALAELAAWLRHGPPSARVREVRREPLPDQACTGFVIG